jgi:protein tyrosine phosphatase (PTP) superfamily phosphohydrolase (DUF442 family)
MIEDSINFIRFSEKLISSGMPTAEQIKSAAEAGTQVVINLAPHTVDDALQGEEKLVSDAGMKYVNIPVVWGNPTRENLDGFMRSMNTYKENNVYVHCQANYRATCFITLDRILRLGWERDKAVQDLERIWNVEDYPVWQDFFEENVKK